MNRKLLAFVAILSATALLGAGCGKGSLFSGNSTEPADPAIMVSDQKLSGNNEVVIEKASMPENGWIAIHNMGDDRQMKEIIGYTALNTGTRTNIKISVDRNKATPSLVAMLHYDRDPKGTFESPGSDGPVIINQQVIMKEFIITNHSELGVNTASAETTGSRKEFVVTAKQWSFSPATIKVKKGDKVVLKITSTDVSHGFNLPTFNINETLEPGKTKTVEFVADKTGTFTFSCSVACGAGHKAMTGTLIVE